MDGTFEREKGGSMGRLREEEVKIDPHTWKRERVTRVRWSEGNNRPLQKIARVGHARKEPTREGDVWGTQAHYNI